MECQGGVPGYLRNVERLLKAEEMVADVFGALAGVAVADEAADMLVEVGPVVVPGDEFCGAFPVEVDAGGTFVVSEVNEARTL
ncbi:hypothetical protein HDU97_009651 [Phlyctochytrium planicorne]|nr:hypothetical protein HDU97_009651 [Phlyctochytrium planicorne]